MKFSKLFKSLQIRIFLIIFILLLIPVVLLLNYNFVRTEAVLRDNTSKLILSNLEQIGQKIDNVSEDIMKISSMVSSNSVILSSLSGYGFHNVNDFRSKNLETLGAEDVIKISDVQKQIYYVKNNFFNYNMHVILFGADGNIYCSLDTVYDEFDFKLSYIKKYRNQSWYSTLQAGETLGVWSAPFGYDMENNDQRYISLARVIKDNLTQDKLGIIMVNFSETNFKQYLGSDVNGIVTLLNKEKELIFTSNANEEDNLLFQEKAYARIPDQGKGNFSAEIRDRSYFVNYYPLRRNGWTLVSMLPYDEVMKEIESLKSKTYIINFCIFGAFFIIAVVLIMHMTNPLKKLIWKIRKMKIGEHSIGLKGMEYSDDVSGIVMSFEYMFKRVEELIKVVIQEHRYENDLKYEALRAQINPHFLFNTLNIIKWSALMSGSENVSKMISALGRLLEVSMNKGEDEITLKDELELAGSYVYIQNIRYNDNLTLLCEVDEGLESLRVLKLILQPVVENSIIHGFKAKTGGQITIGAQIINDKLEVTVKDNGIGISKEKVGHLLDTDSDTKKHRFNSIGLVNIHERLKIKYGNEYGLAIASEEGAGTSVTVLLPVINSSLGGQAVGQGSDS